MRFISIIAMFIMFSSILEAAYIRSIRIGSFLDVDAADQSLYDLKSFVKSSYRLKDLQKEFDFDVKTIRSGRYYITVIEPVTDKRAVQEILDIVRTLYPNTYPKKIKFKHKRKSKNRYQSHYNRYKETKIYKEVQREKLQEPIGNQLDLIENIDSLLEEETVLDPVVQAPRKHRFVNEALPEEKTSQNIVKKSLEKEEPKKEVNYKRFELKRTATLKPTQEQKDTTDDIGFSIFGYEISVINFSELKLPDFSFDMMNSEEAPHKTTKGQLHDSGNGNLSVFENYKLEILVVLTFFFIIILLKFIAMYRHNKEDQISIQDIYN